MTTLADPQPSGTAVAWRPLAALAGAMLVAGVLLGVIWTAWSPPGPRGGVLKAGIQPDETESFVSADGRFALLTAVVGVIAGICAWYLRRQRGSLLALALAAGGLGGSLLTDWIGHLVRGEGRTYACGTETGRCIEHLPLTVQMHGLLFLEAAVAVLVYSLFVAFAVDDDLGRPDPAREARLARRSVRPQGGVEDAWSEGDRPGPPQQHDFPPQNPHQPLQPPGGGEFGQH
jgi:hypothetical protein